jgi:propionate catabolism operon transcriptional regulator
MNTVPALRDRPVIWTVSVSRLTGLLRDVIPEFDHRARIESLHLGFDEAVRTLRRRLATEDCDVIIAAGSNGAWLRNRLDMPLVLIRPSGFDLMNALTQARRLSPRIGVITHESELPVFARFQQSFDLDIEQRTFLTEEDARGCVAELVSQGVRAIVGTGMVTDLAEKAGVAGVLMYSPDSVREAFESAIDLARLLGNAGPARSPASTRPRQRNHAGARYRITDLRGDSPPMRQLRRSIERVAATDATVLITGETGTGKELVAHAVHAGSTRSSGPFMAVNCGAIAESLLESELFGHDEGAFTGARRGGSKGLFEAAHGGSLFLDEIGEMPLPLQTRLLRVLEEREVVRVGATRSIPVDIRVIAATHCDLDAMVRDGRFRSDLYYRLNVLRLHVPSLAEHRDDIIPLARGFLRRRSQGAMSLSPEAEQQLQRHDWPGNVRELKNAIERIAVMASAPLIDADTVARCLPSSEITESRPAKPTRGRPDPATLNAILDQHNGDRSQAAQALGVSRTTLWRWLRA